MYVGRFAPSPTGPLHAGSLVAALASWLDARAHAGRWLVRIEDVDTPRCQPGADRLILQQLAACGLLPDEPPAWQSQRSTVYAQALDRLAAAGLAYPCACSRKDIERAQTARGLDRARGGELIYPGTCRPERGGPQHHAARAWRFRTSNYEEKTALALVQQARSAINFEASGTTRVVWHDRRLGRAIQDVASAVGDFVLLRADGLWAYQLAVVLDDAAQGITHIVRGEDLADNTPRQILLQAALGLTTPRYLHTPLVLAPDGQKLSKQNGAQPLDLSDPLAALQAAAAVLELPVTRATHIGEALAEWRGHWTTRWGSANA